MTTSTTAPASHAAPALPPIVGLSGEVAADRRLTLTWTRDPAYVAYEIHESTADPAHTVKATVPAPPRVSGKLAVRATPLRYGVRGRTADGAAGPFGHAVEVRVRESGGTVTVTGEPFTLPEEPPPNPSGSGEAPSSPGALIPAYWKLTTTLRDAAKDDDHQPLEIFRDGHTKLDGEKVFLETFKDPDHWRLTNEQGRWGIKITCPSQGFTTRNSHNMRWELRQMDAAGADQVNFDLVDGGPSLDTEIAVLDLQGNAGVLSQVHGKWFGPDDSSEEAEAGDDDLTVWRAEPNGNDDTYTLLITKQDDPHGGFTVDENVRYGQVIKIGYRIARHRVRFVYNGKQLDFEMPVDGSMHIDFTKTKFYFRAGLYLQVADRHRLTEGTVILYSATIG